MAKAAANQQAYALISLFIKRYQEKYEKSPADLNRYRDKWGFQDMIDQLGYEDSRGLVDFYFTMTKYGHPVSYLLYNYEKIDAYRRELAEDEANRIKLREQTRLKVMEWDKQNGNT